MTFSDHFCGHARAYADARPRYPPALFAWLAAQCPTHGLAWDAGCGNGQATTALAAYFDRVVGSDPSATQIESAGPCANVDYRVEPAEQPSLEANSVDLVLVAQALHWFQQAPFHTAVARVLRPQGVFAAVSYGLSTVTADVDRVFLQLYQSLDPWWPAERRHVEDGYRNLPFPYTPIAPAPDFSMQHNWTLPHYLAYLDSWSASQRCRRETGRDAVAEHSAAMAAAWGDPRQTKVVRWPLTLKVGRRR